MAQNSAFRVLDFTPEIFRCRGQRFGQRKYPHTDAFHRQLKRMARQHVATAPLFENLTEFRGKLTLNGPVLKPESLFQGACRGIPHQRLLQQLADPDPIDGLELVRWGFARLSEVDIDGGLRTS